MPSGTANTKMQLSMAKPVYSHELDKLFFSHFALVKFKPLEFLGTERQ